MALPRLENPTSPWDRTLVDYLGEPPEVRLELFEDHSRTILSKNDSPDLGFRYSVNPYRGCFHGCAYCYARPTHEYLGFGAGTDFERRIVVKPKAPELLREALAKNKTRGELILFSGNTDCYQPIEGRFRLTRRCLEVCVELAQPVHVITKSPLVERDIDVLAALGERTRVGVTVSIPFSSAEHARAVEPYVASPARRFETIRRLTAAGVPVSVNVAPVIPGLNDGEIAEVLERAREAGAERAAFIIVRLPGNVRPVFEGRIRENLPLRAERILARTREVRSGRTNDPRFGTRMTGEGIYAESIARLFEVTAKKLGYKDVGRFRADGSELESSSAAELVETPKQSAADRTPPTPAKGPTPAKRTRETRPPGERAAEKGAAVTSTRALTAKSRQLELF